MISALLDATQGRMDKTIEDLTRSLSVIRTGRASVHLLDGILVDYYGTLTPINQLSTLHVPEPTMIMVQPWDVSQIREIERAMLSSDLGINPTNDGKVIQVPIPSLTNERRQELARQVHRISEEHKTALRSIRRDSNETLKKALKNKEISEDNEFKGLAAVQKVTDEFVLRVEGLSNQKEKEILEF
jgi:ribosome recycling factor